MSIFFFFCLLPLTTIHQTTKESFTRWVQDSWISATIYWLVAIRYYHIEFFFWCHQSPGSTSAKFCGRFFILIKKLALVCFKLNVVKFNSFQVCPRHPQVPRCLVNVFVFLFSTVNSYSYKKNHVVLQDHMTN